MSQLLVKEIDTLDGNPNTVGTNAPLGQPLIDRTTGYFYLKSNALGATPPTWRRIDQVENVQASYGGDTRGIGTRFGEMFVNAMDWLEGDGSTDDAESLALLASLISEDSEVFFPAGTYLFSTVEIGKRLNFRGVSRGLVTFKHKAGATNHMIRFTAAQKGQIENITFDGNKSNQDKSSNWYSLLYNYSDGQTLRGCTFQNYMKAAVLDDQTVGQWTVADCRFLNGLELDNADEFSNGAITFQAAVASARAKITVTECLFAQDANPATGKRAPGAFYSAGSYALDCRPSIIFTHNRIHLMGGRHPTLGHGRAAVDFYESTLNGICSHNIIKCATHSTAGANWIPGKFDNCQNLTVIGNIVSTPTASAAFRYVPGERAQTAEFKTAKFIGNTVEDSANCIAFLIDAGVGGFHDIIIANNSARDVTKGIDINGLLDDAATNEGFGPVLITGNQFICSGGNGIEIDSTQADIKITDNYIDVTSGNGLRATSDNVNSTVHVKGNTIICRTAAFIPLDLWGLKEAQVIGNTLNQTTGSAATRIKADALSNKIQYLVWENNTLQAGTLSITWADIVRHNLRRFDVKEFGATGDGSTDDTAAIQRAITVAESFASVDGQNGPVAKIYFPQATAYRTTSALVITRNIDVEMDAPIMLDDSTGNITALTIGEEGPSKDNNGRSLKLSVYRETAGDWSSESQIGIKLISPVEGEIQIRRADGFTIGFQLVGGAADGAVHNNIYLGRLHANAIALDLKCSAGGWVNENNFFGGRFAGSTAVGHDGLKRIGVRIGTAGESASNNNRFYGSSFELMTASATPSEALPVEVVNGTDNYFYRPRNEANSEPFIRTLNTSTRNVIQAGYGGATIAHAGTIDGGFVVGGGALDPAGSAPKRTVFHSGPLHRLACYYDGATGINVPRIHWQDAGATPVASKHSVNNAALNANYLEMTGANALGVFMDTRQVKTFVVHREANASANGGRILIRCYDSAGSVLTSAGAGHPYVLGSSAFGFTANFGGCYFTSSDSDVPVQVTVGADVASVAVLIGRSSVNVHLRSFSIEVMDPNPTAVWAGYEEVVPGANIGSAAPTAGTWSQGRRVYNAAPAASGTEGWICTTAGTPGTWKTFGAIAA